LALEGGEDAGAFTRGVDLRVSPFLLFVPILHIIGFVDLKFDLVVEVEVALLGL